MGLKIDAAVYCHIGGRKNNEDNFYFNGLYMEREQMNRGGAFHKTYSGAQQMYAVCDGMGGAEFGEEASLCTAKVLKRYQEECREPDRSANLDRMVNEASRKVDEISLSRNMPSGASGSTLAMLLFNSWYFRTVHVGDSRIYRLRNGELKRITKDHSEVQRLIDSGQITPDQAWMHPRKNVITRHLGMPTRGRALTPSIGDRVELEVGDRYIICSDGLNDVVRDAEIERIMMAVESAEDTASALVRKALGEADKMRIESDNITVIVLDIKQVGKGGRASGNLGKLRALRGMFGTLAAACAAGSAYFGYDIIRFMLKK